MSQINGSPVTLQDPDDLENNLSGNPHLNDVLAARLHRRHIIKGGVGALAVAGFGPMALVGCAGTDDDEPVVRGAAKALGFNALSKSLIDSVQVPAGYTATVIYATGDSIDAAVPAYLGNGTEANYARRAGDHHDGLVYFGLNAAASARDVAGTERALLAINHENITGTAQFLHPTGETNVTGTAARPEAEVIKEIEAHGVSVIEIQKAAGKFALNKASTFNRRITARTEMSISGPVRGSDFVKTQFSPNGLISRGTLNNCGSGLTPWGTYVTAEENWAGYFIRDAGDDTKRTQRENTQLLRNGLRPASAGFAHRRWASVVPADAASTDFSRWNCSVKGAAAADDFRNEHNTFGYIVEIDPYDPNSRPKKRTAMGRRANEGATCSVPKAGEPLAFYIGCDSRGEYIYKFVTKAAWDAADAQRGGMATGDKYLDEGTIYAAKFNADGTGTWVKVDLSNPAVAAGVPVSAQNPGGYTFADLADICVNTRLAAGAAGATRMDRPEWTAVNPFNGEIYITLTENPDRGAISTVSGNNVPNPDVDAANPRYWLDSKGISSQGPAAPTQRGNVNGHVMRIREDADTAAAVTFKWDIFLFGAQAAADAGADDVYYQKQVNLSGLTPLNDLSKPDGCWFSRATGILWIETDDNTFTDQTNCMLLACIPGQQGDGGPIDVVNAASGSPDAAVRTAGADKTVRTYAGRKMTDATFKRFLVGPTGSEITGVTESPDGKVLFVDIQHPGENTGRTGAIKDTVALSPTTLAGPFESNWPGNGGGVAAYGPGGATARPRSATLMITRDDGGVIGI
jgi:uncharacterized protein